MDRTCYYFTPAVIGDKSELRNWAKDKDRLVRWMSKHVGVRVKCRGPGLYFLEYDLRSLHGFVEEIAVQRDETLSEAQRRFLLDFARTHDLERHYDSSVEKSAHGFEAFVERGWWR